MINGVKSEQAVVNDCCERLGAFRAELGVLVQEGTSEVWVRSVSDAAHVTHSLKLGYDLTRHPQCPLASKRLHLLARLGGHESAERELTSTTLFGVGQLQPLFQYTPPSNNLQGRVVRDGLLGNVKAAKSSKKPLRPDEVLFKRKNAPVRYEEDDYYPAHRRLPPGQELPSGDLAAALHAHVFRLWANIQRPGRHMIRKSMDETALIALSILMEETARGVLGETGDLAFTEAVDEDEQRVLGCRLKRTEDQGKKRMLSGVDDDAEEVGVRHGSTDVVTEQDGWSSSDVEPQYASEDSE
ncbi:hypothetical protein GMOD_00005048 [Pyrenophora seminiperda CCB06]|uniref:Uncharacterized protein n=1 Tax=Pyrenophora seminiperda CCB06 TaxID=1302712 RepID=A0A3M7MI29_9PLEO|nr:hypothetical protein GMOD_00005048 [Pyrenophora seminiperda CCB06]